MTVLLGMNTYRWVAIDTALLTLLLLADAFVGHYRSGFVVKAQYAPFFSGALLIAAALLALFAPEVAWVQHALVAAGWIAVAAGFIGFGFHQYYGVARKPGGYRWLLHHSMYGAPPLAPLALAVIGMFGVLAAHGLAGEKVAGWSVRAALLALASLALLGASAQATLLHFRGAFNNPLMYVPLTVPVLAAVAGGWFLLAPQPWLYLVLNALLWLTFTAGFIGLGMHLRGFDREMGGLYIPGQNIMNGPALSAPALFSGFAAVALLAVVTA